MRKGIGSSRWVRKDIVRGGGVLWEEGVKGVGKGAGRGGAEWGKARGEEGYG